MLAKEIAVNGQCYIYDGYTNKIVPSEKYCEAPHKQYNGIVEKPISMRQTDRYENLHTMILQITRNCNMRCTYCVYSGHFSYAFPHAEESMSLDTIRRAIDFFEEHSRGSDEAAICFYGGEALIVFDDVQYAIQYAEEKMKNRKLNFGIISNGLLLNERIVDYLCQHSNVSVQVTLNGMDHDDSRKDISGNGTLARIIKNMQSIRFGYPQVWERQVNFTANIKSYADIEGLQIFYQNYVGKEPTLITRISTRGCAEEIASQYTYDYLSEMFMYINLLIMEVTILFFSIRGLIHCFRPMGKPGVLAKVIKKHGWKLPIGLGSAFVLLLVCDGLLQRAIYYSPDHLEGAGHTASLFLVHCLEIVLCVIFEAALITLAAQIIAHFRNRKQRREAHDNRTKPF